jgi:hypothetical protein
MAHFAKVVDGIVTQVIVADQEFINSYMDTSPGFWLQASYNTVGGVHYGPDGQPDGGEPLRKNFPGAGWSYDSERDAFIPPKPVTNPSWVLDEDTCRWVAPTACPSNPPEGKYYAWNESTLSWDLTDNLY